MDIEEFGHVGDRDGGWLGVGSWGGRVCGGRAVDEVRGSRSCTYIHR